jgi:hypothetical protein
MIVRRVLAISTAACMILILLACTPPTGPEKTVGGLLIIHFSADLSRNLAPDVNLTVTSYDVVGRGPNEAIFTGSATVAGGGTLSKKDLAPGVWTITATGKNSDDHAIVVGGGTVTIVAAKEKSLEITCLPFSGNNGTLSLTLSWPSEKIGDYEIIASLTPKGETVVVPISFESVAGSASYFDDTCKNGYYTLSIELWDRYDVDKLCWYKVETVLILANEETSWDWGLLAGDLAFFTTGTVNMTIGSDSRKPVELVLGGQDAELESGSTMTVTASGAPVGSTYRWYMNGEEIQTGSSASVTVGPEFAEGLYWLYAVAESGEVAGSAGCTFRVSPYTPPAIFQGTSFTKDGIAMSLTNDTAPGWTWMLHHLDPKYFYENGTHYFVYNDGMNKIAHSTDFVTWETGIALSPGGAYPNITKRGIGDYLMYYVVSDSICVATSTDLLNWTSYNGNPVLPKYSPFNGIANPNVLPVDGGYRMYYFGNDGNDSKYISMATSSNGISWTKYQIDPLLTSHNQTYVNRIEEFEGEGSMIVINGKYYLYYGYIDAAGNTGIALIKSDDGVAWSAANVQTVLSPSTNPADFDFDRVTSASAYFDGQKIWLYYVGKKGLEMKIGKAYCNQ